MIDIKVNLTILVPGAKQLSKEECLKTIQKEVPVFKKNKQVGTKIITKEVEDFDKCDKTTLKNIGKDKQEIHIFTRKYIPAQQSINISREAYDNWIDKNYFPTWEKPSNWKNMSKKARVKSHCQKIAEHLNGELLDFVIFDD